MATELELFESELKDLKTRRDRVMGLIFDPLNTRIRVLEQKLAELKCPFQVGDVLVNDRGDRAQVETIEPPTGHGDDKDYSLSGFYVKKNGKPWKNPGRDNQRPRVC